MNPVDHERRMTMKDITRFIERSRWKVKENYVYSTTKLSERYRNFISCKIRGELEVTPKLQEAICDYILFELQRINKNSNLDIIFMVSEEVIKNKPIIYILVEHDEDLTSQHLTKQLERIDFILPTVLYSHHRIPTVDNLRPIMQPNSIDITKIIRPENYYTVFSRLEDRRFQDINNNNLFYYYDFRQHYFNLVEPKITMPNTSNQLNVLDKLQDYFNEMILTQTKFKTELKHTGYRRNIYLLSPNPTVE